MTERFFASLSVSIFPKSFLSVRFFETYFAISLEKKDAHVIYLTDNHNTRIETKTS